MTHPHSGAHPTAHDNHHSDLATTLERDGLLAGAHLQEILDWASQYHPSPRMIVDLGAGTGSGTVRLARTFPAAHVVAIDQSEAMLTHVAAAADRAQVLGRVASLQIDLDTGWPDLRNVDLMWAASSMHHLSDPARAFTLVRGMLSPSGIVVIVEMDALPRYLPRDLGVGAAGLEQRLHDASALATWNSHHDWGPVIEGAGMDLIDHRTFAYDTKDDPDLIMRAAHDFLRRAQEGLGEALPDEDLETITQLLDASGPHALSARTDLSMRGSRTVWVGRNRT